MKKYLLSEKGNFYKANLHCHTNLSDGNKSPEEVKEIYKSLGYSVVAFTDHDIFISHNDLTDDSFLALNGFEVEINEHNSWEDCPKTCHICFVSLDRDKTIQPMWNRTDRYMIGNGAKYAHMVKFNESEPDYIRSYTHKCVSEMMSEGVNKGFFVTYNHPSWSLEQYPDYIGYKGMRAMEIFNGDCLTLGYEDYNPRVYDDMLKAGNRIYCVGGDDNHNATHREGTRAWDSGVAFTVIKAESLEYSAVAKALSEGNFYASCAPEIYELWYEDGRVHIKCSDADRINCNFDTRDAKIVFAEGGEPLVEAEFDIPCRATYFRITVTDKCGKKACTNAYFTDELDA